MLLSKAYDTVSHRLLQNKLEGEGIQMVINQWIASHLEDRRQVVLVDGNRSRENKINMEVPQESILCPLLFTIFMDELVTK